MKYYRVEFETKVGGYKHWAIDVTTTSIAKAKETAKNLWESNHCDGHQFHLRARVLKDTEELLYNYFTRVDKPKVNTTPIYLG
jgi:hypothetical protein